VGLGQTTTALNAEATKMNNLASSQGDSKVVDKISSDFSSFLGADSKAVVTGLRNGTPITLTRVPSTTTGVATTEATIINPPTGKMGHGNVYISLALAKQQLGAVGITEPTPQQLQAALTGGQVTTTTGTTGTGTPMTSKQNLDGILTMRSQNMGWGQISQKLGYKLGPVISSMKHTNQNIARLASTTASVKGSGHAKSGIVSAGGQSDGNSNNGRSNGRGSGSGIVSASGKVGAGAYGNTHGKSNIVTGSGHSHSAASGGVVSAGGNGSGHGKGPNK
jgi:hypothetical protein